MHEGKDNKIGLMMCNKSGDLTLSVWLPDYDQYIHMLAITCMASLTPSAVAGDVTCHQRMCMVTCSCTVTGTTSSTQWRIRPPNGSLCAGDLITLPQSPPCAGREVPSSSGRCGPFVARNVGLPGDHCRGSELEVAATEEAVEGTAVSCQDMQGPALMGGVTLHALGMYYARLRVYGLACTLR